MSSNEEKPLSPIEQVYDRNIAARKLKHGTKYEQLTALVFQVLDADSTIVHDVKLRGDGKRTVHQIDVHVTRGDQTTRVIIECRDKTDPNKVGLDEARSFATVIHQLKANGIIVTTTGFTKGARTLATDEGLQLFTLRPFLEADKEGRLMAIDVTARAVMPVPDDVKVLTANDVVFDLDEGSVVFSMDTVIVDGSKATTFRDLLGGLMDTPLKDPVPEGPQTATRAFDPPVVLDVDGRHLEIAEMRVDYHVETDDMTFRIDAGGRVAELILQSLDESYDKVIWDEDLQRYIVDPATGVVIQPGEVAI